MLKETVFAFLDLETTGGNSSTDRITEVGVRLWREGEVLEEWQRLVNPDTRIPAFIQSFTGITDAMVADAPRFEAIADELQALLKGCVLVAHNARFDYAFLKAEYRRLGQSFALPVLCTVKLSRKLYPEHDRHNMDTLIARHSLPQVKRHRAIGDVEAMQAFFEHVLVAKGEPVVVSAIKDLLLHPAVPSHLPPDILAYVPRGPGVYRFYGEDDVLLYVGKSTHMRERVASHFSGDHNSRRGVQLSQRMRRVEWTETAGDLSAMLLELKEIKTLSPLYNRRSRAAKRLLSIELRPNEDGFLQARLVREIDPQRLGDYYGLFRSKKDAEVALRGVAAKNELCGRLLGLEPPGQGPCFQRTLGRCKGACEGLEDVLRYNLRAQIGFHGLHLKTWPWPGPVGVVEQDPESGRTDILVIYNWMHIDTVHSEAELTDLSLKNRSVTFDMDSYKLVVKALLGRGGTRHRVIELPALGAPEILVPAGTE
ncbi:MAG: GIY-YIG nuclease family protein [Marinobacter sp.]|nr:GIY-YIG nuclease family protein [Marinobacter sp.]